MTSAIINPCTIPKTVHKVGEQLYNSPGRIVCRWKSTAALRFELKRYSPFFASACNHLCQQLFAFFLQRGKPIPIGRISIPGRKFHVHWEQASVTWSESPGVGTSRSCPAAFVASREVSCNTQTFPPRIKVTFDLHLLTIKHYRRTFTSSVSFFPFTASPMAMTKPRYSCLKL